VIDEAQNIQDIGINIKILHDANPSLKIILTGSSSFELANQTSEPLTGRKRTFTLFPISIGELAKQLTGFDIKQKLDEYLRFGLYPDILNTNNVEEKKIRLKELSSSYLYKDVLQLSNIRNSQKIFKLLQLLALQIGSTVSVNKLGNSLNMSNDTVERYIDLLEKSYVIFRRTGFSRNLSKEISKMDKIYFYDLGIRNAILDNFNTIDLRSDAGALWENFIIAERLKHNFYSENEKRSYFWRTYTGAEIDMIEETEGKLFAFEIKFNNKTVKAPKTWEETYNSGEFHTINKDNFLQFIS
jgi:predicted AAA+ superfamily ATPase